MKKFVLVAVSLFVFLSCSDSPVSPTKEYPISHQDLSLDLAFKINETRRLLGNVEIQYLPSVSYKYENIIYDFHTQTRKENINPYQIIIYNNNYDSSITIYSYPFWCEKLDNIVDTLIKKPLFSSFFGGNKDEKTVRMAINIMEVKNTEPKLNILGNENPLYGLNEIVVYVYKEIKFKVE